MITKFSTLIIMLVLFHIPVSKNVLVCSLLFDLNISRTLSLYLSLNGKTNDQANEKGFVCV